MAALPVAGLVTVASAAAVSLTSGVAAADTPSYTVTCTGVPVIGTAAFTSQVTGTISPNPVNLGSGFSLSGYSLVFTIAPGLVQIATASGNATVLGTVQFNVDATGATPAVTPITANIPSTTMTAAEDTTGAVISIPLTSPTWIASGTATSASLVADVNYSVALTLNGTAVPAFSCTSPSTEQIDTATITPTPYIAVNPTSYAFTSATDSTPISVSGGNWGGTSVSLTWSSPTTGADSATCPVSGGSISAGCTLTAGPNEVGTNQAPFFDNVVATGVNGASAAATASAAVQFDAVRLAEHVLCGWCDPVEPAHNSAGR